MNRVLEFANGNFAPSEPALLAFVLTSFVVEMTPGPNMAYLAVLGATRGLIAGFSAVLGVALGIGLLGIAAGLGGGSLILNNSLAYDSLRWAGSLYLCWLAYDTWQEGRRPINTAPINLSSFAQFRRGFITNLLNPKAGLFFVVVLPEFVTGPAPTTSNLAALISIYVGVATLVHSLIVLLASGSQLFFSAPQRREVAGSISAIIIFFVAVWLFLSSEK